MNYNPKSDITLLSKVADNAQESHLENLSNNLTISTENKFEKIDVRVGGQSYSYTMRLVTNYEHLARFWRLNFKECQIKENIDGEIFVIDTYKTFKMFNFNKYRYYFKSKDRVLSLNNDFYGNLKISYRGLGANIAISENILTLHSAAININNKSIVITGVSGAGKSTIFLHLLQLLNGRYIWDDWGFVDPKSLSLIIPNEFHNHLKLKSLNKMINDQKVCSKSLTEFHSKGHKLFESARIMINLRDYIHYSNDDLTIDTLIIVTNLKNCDHFVKKITCKKAEEYIFALTFSKAYKQNVLFFNGALFLDDVLIKKHKILFSMLLKNVKNIIQVNNIYTPIDFNSLEKLL